jgi:hypothetical protein
LRERRYKPLERSLITPTHLGGGVVAEWSRGEGGVRAAVALEHWDGWVRHTRVASVARRVATRQWLALYTGGRGPICGREVHWSPAVHHTTVSNFHRTLPLPYPKHVERGEELITSPRHCLGTPSRGGSTPADPRSPGGEVEVEGEALQASPSNAHSSPPRTSVVVLLPSGAEVWAELSEHLAVLEV